MTSLGKPAPAHEWLTDWEAAKTAARQQGKDLLVDFTGSDWCGWCVKLREEVFDTGEFREGAAKDFVLVELDFPQRKELPEALRAQNEQLQVRFGVRGYPTIVLCDAEGLPYAKTGYRPGGPRPYLAHLGGLRQQRAARDEALAAAQARTGSEAARRYGKALETVPAELRDAYTDWMERIVELDADGKAGLRDRYRQARQQILMASEAQDAQARFLSSFRAKEFAGAARIVGEFLAQHSPQGDLAQRLHYYHGIALLQDGKPHDAVAALERSRAADPDSSAAGEIEQAIQVAKQRAAPQSASRPDSASGEAMT